MYSFTVKSKVFQILTYRNTVKDLLLPNTVNQKDEKPHTAGLDDTAIPHIKIKVTETSREKKLNTVNPHVPLPDVSVFCDIIWFCFLFLFRLQTWVLAQRIDEQTSIHDRWFGWSIRASDSSFCSSPCYNDINAVVIDGKESFADLKNPHPPRLRCPGLGGGGGEGHLKFHTGRSAQRSKPLPFCVPFLASLYPPIIQPFLLGYPAEASAEGRH